ncbi:MAG: PTS sugar transporter subunit IIA [Phycisphaerae bacterium]
MKLQDLVKPGAIVPELTSTNRAGVIRELIEVLAATGQIPQEEVESLVKSIIARESSRGSTGIGKGVAIPHTKTTKLPAIAAAVGRSAKGVDFAALDGAPVFAIFLIVSPEADTKGHLGAMDVVFRTLQSEQFRKFFRQSDTAEKIYDLLREADEEILAV